jgi:hypothetical protein
MYNKNKMDNFDLKKYLVENKVTNNSKISESIISKLASLFQRTPSETKLLNSLDLFDDNLLEIGERKLNIVIERAKEFGMDINDEQAYNIIQKKLAMELENLK